MNAREKRAFLSVRSIVVLLLITGYLGQLIPKAKEQNE